MRPSSSTSIQSRIAPSWAASHSTLSIVAWCSAIGTRILGFEMRPLRGRSSTRDGLRAQNSPLMPRFTASVPPPVSTTSTASAPSDAAICSRPSSSSARAVCPAPWIDDGLPTTPRASVYARSTSGRIGAVAA